MKRHQLLIKLLLIAFASLSAVQAAEKKAQSKEQQEEVIRQEALALIFGTDINRESVTGVFEPSPDEIANTKPLPKVVGVLVQKGTAQYLMVNQKATLEYLIQHKSKEVTLMAKCLDKGDKGKWLIADEVVQPSGGGATVIRKRGGL
jgi:hypothetical protein